MIRRIIPLMKRLAFLLAVPLTFSLAACGSQDKSAPVPEDPAPAVSSEPAESPAAAEASPMKEEPVLPEAEEEAEQKTEPLQTEGYTDGDPDSLFQDGAGAFFPSYMDGFYGIWTSADAVLETAIQKAEKLYDLGYSSFVAYAPEWENLSEDPYFCVTAGRFDSEEEANDKLAEVKAAGYQDAYIKHTGNRMYTTVEYIDYGNARYEVSPDEVVIKDIGIGEAKTWYPGFDENENSYLMTLVIDANTVFDASCETEFFGNYEDGDTPLTWFLRSYELMETDPDAYTAYGPALSGIFEVGINGTHIDRYFGSYWWD